MRKDEPARSYTKYLPGSVSSGSDPADVIPITVKGLRAIEEGLDLGLRCFPQRCNEVEPAFPLSYPGRIDAKAYLAVGVDYSDCVASTASESVTGGKIFRSVCLASCRQGYKDVHP